MVKKDRWKNNLGLKIMAVLFAIFLWWTVVNIDDPVNTQSYDIEVTVKNAQVVTNAGKSYQIADKMKKVSVTIRARRKVLSEIDESQIVAIADFMEMDKQSGLVPIRVETGSYDLIEATANPRNIKVTTEDTQKKTFPIQVATTGVVREGYVLDKENMIVSPQTIDISGPKSSLLRINRVVAKVDVSELSEDTNLKAELIYYDSADNIIDKSLLSSNCDKNGVSIEVILLKTKEVEVRFDTSEIKPGEEYLLDSLEVEPQKIKVTGKNDILSELEYISVGSQALRQEGIVENRELVIDIEEYLPKGITLVNEDAGTVVVRIILEKVGTKSILLPVRSIKVEGTPEKFEVSYGPEQEVELKFSGADEVLRSLTSEKIIAMIDLSAYQEAGTYDVPVQVTDLPEHCKYLGETSVQVTFAEKQVEEQVEN